jgi:hypothetical protein
MWHLPQAGSAEDDEHQAALRGFYLGNGGWKGPGWQQISWRRRKRMETIEAAEAANKKAVVATEKARWTPMGRMEDESLANWGEITSDRYKRALTSSYNMLLTYAEDSQLSQNLGSMSYEELLTGLLFPGEELQNTPPARIKNLKKIRHDGTLIEEHNLMRVFFTDKRLFFLHTNFFQQPTVRFEQTKFTADPLMTQNIKLGCELEDNFYWTSISLEKILGQTIDCEYRAMSATQIVVSRPFWGAWLLKAGLFCLLSVPIASFLSMLALAAMAGLTLLLLGSGMYVLLNMRHYELDQKPTTKYANRSLIFGVDDPVAMELVTLRLELEDDYRLDAAFDFIQGLRSVSRQLRGEILVDQDKLLDSESLMVGKEVDYESESEEALLGGSSKSSAERKRNQARARGKSKKKDDAEEEGEIKMVKPPKSKNKKANRELKHQLAESLYEDDDTRETVADIKKKQEEAQEARWLAESDDNDERIMASQDFREDIKVGIGSSSQPLTIPSAPIETPNPRL